MDHDGREPPMASDMNQQPGYVAPDYDVDTGRTGWTGWIGFVADDDHRRRPQRPLRARRRHQRRLGGVGEPGSLFLDISQWGWVHLIIGLVVLLSGIGVFSGNLLARTVGVIAAAVSLIANFLFIPAYPLWAIAVITIDVLVIWALTAHGGEMRPALSPIVDSTSRRTVAMSIGPIQAFVVAFPDSDLFEGRIAEDLARLSDIGQIRIVDAVFVMRDGDDAIALGVSDLDDEQRAELRAAVGR